MKPADSGEMNGCALNVLQMFLNWQQIQKNYSPATLNAYGSDLKQFENFLSEKKLTLGEPGKIRSGELRNYIAWLHKNGISKSSISRKLSTLRALFSFLEKRKLIDSNPAQGLHNPKQNQYAPKILNVDECFSLLDHVSSEKKKEDFEMELRNRALAELLYGSGLRISEALSLNIDDIQPGCGIVRITGKGSRQRLVPVGEAAKDAIAAWTVYRQNWAVKGEAALFVGKKGKRLNRREAWRIIQSMCVAAGLQKKISPHGLRHSFASHMLMGGADIREVQELLGHKRISTTQKYTHFGLDALIKIYDSSHPRSN